MKNSGQYEINFREIFAICLAHWKRIIIVVLLCGLTGVAFTTLTFKAPPSNSFEYRKIENAIVNRRVAEEKLVSLRKSYDDNQFYKMDPDLIMLKQLTIAVELTDQSSITDQIDPTDMVLYAYHNLARTHLRGDVLVPTVITKLQREQLVDIGYNSSNNTITVTMVSDDESLIDTVMAVAAGWYTDQSTIVTEQTQSHKLTVLPVSVNIYDRVSAENLVSTVNADATIRSYEDKIMSYNAELDEMFKKNEEWALLFTVDELEGFLAEKIEKESMPGYASSAVIGVVVGLLLACFSITFASTVNRRIVDDISVEHVTGWRMIGRINEFKETYDPLVKLSRRILCRDSQSDVASRVEKTSAMLRLLIDDVGLSKDAKIAFIGDFTAEANRYFQECTDSIGCTVETSLLCGDLISANMLTRNADAIVFVGKFGDLRETQIAAMHDILSLSKKPVLGYILV